MNAVVELTDVPTFQARVKAARGVIVIEDRATRAGEPLAHWPNCPDLSEARFVEKAVRNAGRQGRYWWASSFVRARDELGARKCDTCAQWIQF